MVDPDRAPMFDSLHTRDLADVLLVYFSPLRVVIHAKANLVHVHADRAHLSFRLCPLFDEIIKAMGTTAGQCWTGSDQIYKEHTQISGFSRAV